MQRLLAAIINAFNANATLVAAFPGGLHFMESPPGTSTDYVVMLPVTSPTTHKYGGTAFSEPTMQFTIRGTPNAALVKAETFAGIFDDLTFTLADSKQHFYTRRNGEPIPEPDDPEQDASGNDVTGWIVVYDFATTG